MSRIRKTSGGFGVIPATETSPRKPLPAMQDRDIIEGYRGGWVDDKHARIALFASERRLRNNTGSVDQARVRGIYGERDAPGE